VTLVRCDICNRRHHPDSAMYYFHLAGRDPSDLADTTRADLDKTASGRLAAVINSRGPAGERPTGTKDVGVRREGREWVACVPAAPRTWPVEVVRCGCLWCRTAEERQVTTFGEATK
jgi:hypothetical protein